MTRRDQLALTFFATWTIVGLYLDGWAHEHSKPETFFTPWHGVLYSGFTVGVIWFIVDGRRRGQKGLAPVEAPGGRLSSIGLAIFIAGAIGDFAWHEIFGIEANLEALLSPTHLMLMTGGVILVSGVLREAWMTADPWRDPAAPTFVEFVPILMSLLLTTAVVSFFTMYLSAWSNYTIVDRPEWFRGLRDVAEQREIVGIAGLLFTNALVMLPLLLVLRRWRTPTGTFTVFITMLAVGIQGIRGFERWAYVIPALFGGVVADALVLWLRPSTTRLREVRVVAAGVPLAMWTFYFCVHYVSWGIGWAPELVVGSIFLATLSGLALSLLAFPMEIGAAPPRDSSPTTPPARTPERDRELLAS
jgi:hypothetical protein